MMPLIPFVILSSLALNTPPCPQTITVKVTVKTEGGEPIENAPVRAYALAPSDFGFTNAQGEVILQPQVTEDTEDIAALLHIGVHMELDVQERILANERYMELVGQYYFKDVNTVPYTPGMTEVDIDIIAYESVKVTGTVTSPMPEWANDKVTIDVRGGTWIGQFPPLEPFEARGVQKGHPAELFFLLYEENAFRSVRLTAEQTQNDVHLGEIQFPALGSGAALDITVTDYEDLWEPGGEWPMWVCVTLISIDGETILSYLLNPNDSKVVHRTPLLEIQQPSVPPGIYYVSPGIFGHRTTLWLLDMIRDGAHELLVTAGVPVVVAKDAQTTELTLNAQQTRNAIITAHGVWSK